LDPVVTCLNAFEQMSNFDYFRESKNTGRNSTEFGLFYAISPAHQRREYATEAAQALIDYAFGQLNMKRVIATTDFDNIGSMAVMRNPGMIIEKNPLAGPPWLQVVGVLENR
jgi:RimJ/RimL family protein N-acetyltransferase